VNENDEVAANKSEEKKADEKDEKDPPPPPGNGGTTDKYVWTQTKAALEVFVEVRPGMKAKQLVCDIGVSTLKVGVKGEPLIIDGKFHSKVRPDDSTWSLVDNKVIHIILEKYDGERLWNCVVQGDPTIDTKKCVLENSHVNDIKCDESRQIVEKMIHEGREKMRGKAKPEEEQLPDPLAKLKAQYPDRDFSKAAQYFR